MMACGKSHVTWPVLHASFPTETPSENPPDYIENGGRDEVACMFRINRRGHRP